MKLAIISDLHGDLANLQAALEQAEHFECGLVLCAGDIVDGEPFPEEVIALLRERKLPCIRGNHDRWAIGAGRAIEPNGVLSGAPYDASGFGLSRSAIRYLAQLPTYWEATIGGTRVAMHHGRAGSDMKGVYPDLDRAQARTLLEAAGADILLLGHTHEAFAAQLDDGGLIANPGALWGPGGGTFGVLTVTERDFRVFKAGGGEVQIPRVRFWNPWIDAVSMGVQATAMAYPRLKIEMHGDTSRWGRRAAIKRAAKRLRREADKKATRARD